MAYTSLVERLLADEERERRLRVDKQRRQTEAELDEELRLKKERKEKKKMQRQQQHEQPLTAQLDSEPSTDEGTESDESDEEKKRKKKKKAKKKDRLEETIGPEDAIDERIANEEERRKKKKKEKKKKGLKMPPMPPSPPPEPVVSEGRKTRRQLKIEMEAVKEWRAKVDVYKEQMSKLEGRLEKEREKERRHQEKEAKREERRRLKEQQKQQKRDEKRQQEEEKRKAARKPGDPPEPALVKWAQRHMMLYLTICVSDAKIEALRVVGQKLHFKGIDGASGLSFENDIEFHREISNWRRSPRKNVIELTVEKRRGGWWPRLSTTRGRVPWIGIDEKRWKDMAEFDAEEDDGRPAPKPKESDKNKIKPSHELKNIPDQTKPGSRSVATKEDTLGTEVTEAPVEVVPSTVNYADGEDLDALPELRADTPPPEAKKKESSSDSENDWQKWYYTQTGKKKRKKSPKSRVYWSGMPNDYYKSDQDWFDSDEIPFCY